MATRDTSALRLFPVLAAAAIAARVALRSRRHAAKDSDTTVATTADDDDGVVLIGAGFGRTGTSSTKAALEQLGLGPTHHMHEVMTYGHEAIWGDISDAVDDPVRRRALLRKALKGYRSTLDFPSSYYWRDLIEMYPNAKVLLTTRSAASWYASAWDTILASIRYHNLFSRHTWGNWRGLGMWTFYSFTPMGWALQRVLGAPFSPFANATTEADYCAVFDAWEAQVEATVPPERLLKFSVKEGWGPLAEFVGLPAPEGAFPHVNDKAEFQRILTAISLLGYTVLAGAGLAGFVGGRYAWRRCGKGAK